MSQIKVIYVDGTVKNIESFTGALILANIMNELEIVLPDGKLYIDEYGFDLEVNKKASKMTQFPVHGDVIFVEE